MTHDLYHRIDTFASEFPDLKVDRLSIEVKKAVKKAERNEQPSTRDASLIELDYMRAHVSDPDGAFARLFADPALSTVSSEHPLSVNDAFDLNAIPTILMRFKRTLVPLYDKGLPGFSKETCLSFIAI